MSTAPNCPAAPLIELCANVDSPVAQHLGLTAREHAAIALRVPDSGNDWLDAMIRTAQRNAYAGQAMQAAATNPVGAEGFTYEQRAEWAFKQADAMLAGAATQIEEE